jgi:P-type E1-E2 ATPase
VNIEIPQRGKIELQHAVFDVNGTLAVDGILISGVAERLKLLADLLSIHILTAGTHGNLAELAHTLGYPLQIIGNSQDKAHYVEQLGPATVIAFGNGANDVDMLRLAAVGVAVITAEGAASAALQAADVVVPGPLDAIDLVLKPKRLVATLRG